MGFHLSALQLGPLEGVFANGYRGVVVFFVLSGFLVARPFVAGPVPVGRYLLRRGARILPAYLAALVGITLLTGDDTFPRHALQYLTFTQNFEPSLITTGPLAITWTLQLEVEFYLLLPVLMWAVRGLAGNGGLAGAVVLMVVALTSMLLHLAALISPDAWTYEAGRLSLPAMLWAFIPGVLLAWAIGRWPERTARIGHPVAGAVGLVLFAYGWFGDPVVPLVSVAQSLALSTGTAMVVGWLIGPGMPVVAAWPAIRLRDGLAWFGRTVSYPFYLWHGVLLGLLMAAGLRSWPAFIAGLVLGTLVGVVSWRVFERPAMERSERHIARRRGPPVTSVPDTAEPVGVYAPPAAT